MFGKRVGCQQCKFIGRPGDCAIEMVIRSQFSKKSGRQQVLLLRRPLRGLGERSLKQGCHDKFLLRRIITSRRTACDDAAGVRGRSAQVVKQQESLDIGCGDHLQEKEDLFATTLPRLLTMAGLHQAAGPRGMCVREVTHEAPTSCGV
jgi:hypothetical protein